MQITRVDSSSPHYPTMLARFPSTAGYIADPKDDGDYHFFAAIDPEQGIVGGAVIDIGEMGFGPLGHIMIGYLENIEVDEPMRRRGIGTSLLAAAVDLAWQRGVQNVRWNVDWDNAPGMAFYEAFGAAFVPDSDHDGQPEPFYTLVVVNPKHAAKSAQR